MVVINWYYVVTNQYKFLILMGMCILLKISQTNFTHISKKKTQNPIVCIYAAKDRYFGLRFREPSCTEQQN